MYKKIFVSFFSLFLFSSIVYSQSIGFSVGYGFLNMNPIYINIENSRNIISNFGRTASSYDEITGGLFLEGNFKYDVSNFNLGVTGNYMSCSGDFSYSNIGASFEENYDVSIIEILTLFEAVIPIENSLVQPFIQLAGGIGFVSAEYLNDIKYITYPSTSFSVKNIVDGNYFAGRIKGGIQFFLQNIILEIAAGYRIASAGELWGDHIENGVTVKNIPVKDSSGKSIEFDYSGFLISGGISIVIQ